MEIHVPIESDSGPGRTGIPHELRSELREWHLAGKVARFWLRDDDAVTDTPELRRLFALAADAGTVVGLAVIPKRADASLARLVVDAPCCVWQHGWRHQWQLEEGEQTYSQGEFGAGRPLEPMMADAESGQRALDHLFGQAGWQRVFVPPFHALSVPFKMLLPSLGYWGLSAGHPLTPPFATVAEVNAEMDIMNWPTRNFAGPDVVADMLVKQLQSRRFGQISPDVPIGLLTHHLAHDDEAWRFLTDLLSFLKSHSAAEFVRADRLFGLPGAESADIERLHRGDTDADRVEGITVVVTSCGRQDLLERTLDSFLKHNTYPIAEFIIIEDGDGAANRDLMGKYGQYPFRWFATGLRVGQIAAIDIAYQSVRTDFIFHCEDDWEFTAPGFIEKSLAIMRRNHSILQVWLRAFDDTNRHPLVNYTLTADGIPYRLLRHHHDAGAWGTWHGLSWNPGLRRRRDYQLLGTFGSLDPGTTRETWQVESDASALYQQRGFFAAILACNQGAGFVRHIGGGRRVPRHYFARPAEAEPKSSQSSAPDSTAVESALASVAAVRDFHARILMARLGVDPCFGRVPRICQREQNPGMNELPQWRVWTQRKTTDGQLLIEEQLEHMVGATSSILHIGAGNSSLGRRFASRVSRILGTTVSEEERTFAAGLGIQNYSVLTANKFARDMDRIGDQFDFIVDNNPSGFACCLFHFTRMMISYLALLKKGGGLLLTEQRGLGWVCTDNDPNWSLRWDDWVRLGDFLHMPVMQLTESVYSMQCLPESGMAAPDPAET